MHQNGKRNSLVTLCLLFLLGILLIFSLLPRGTATAQDQPDPVAAVKTDDANEESLDPVVGSPVTGNYCRASGGVGLRVDSIGSFAMDVTGQPVHAYVYWAGRYPSDGVGDNAVQIAINGGTPLMITADQSRQSKLDNSKTYYTYQSVNLVNDVRFTGLLTGAFTVTAGGLQSAGVVTNEGYGIGLVVISAEPSCPSSQVSLYYGLDSFAQAFGGELGPNSEALCLQFLAEITARTLDFDTFIGGATGMNALWYLVGSGTPPTELIANQSGSILDGPPLTALPPLISNVGQQWDHYSNAVVIPAGATFACFQFESVVPLVLNNTQSTSAVWVNFVAQLFTNSVTPLATPTATPTNVVILPAGTATPTNTPTPQPQPSFTLDISINPANPQPGENIVYTLEYANTGQVTLNNLVLRLTIPAHTTFNSSASTADWICNGTGPGSICEFNLGDVEAGEQGTVLFVVTLDPIIAALTEIVLTVQAHNADRTIDLEVSSDAITIIGQQGFRFFLPLISK